MLREGCSARNYSSDVTQGLLSVVNHGWNSLEKDRKQDILRVIISREHIHELKQWLIDAGINT